jgi:hypothetical protein
LTTSPSTSITARLVTTNRTMRFMVCCNRGAKGPGRSGC